MRVRRSSGPSLTAALLVASLGVAAVSLGAAGKDAPLADAAQGVRARPMPLEVRKLGYSERESEGVARGNIFGKPLANLSLNLLDKFGVYVETFGDSTGHLPLLSSV